MKGKLFKFIPGKGTYGQYSSDSRCGYAVRIIEEPTKGSFGMQAKAVVVACNDYYGGNVGDETKVLLDCFEQIAL